MAIDGIGTLRRLVLAVAADYLRLAVVQATTADTNADLEVVDGIVDSILVDTQLLVGRLTAVRAGYLDQLDFNLQEALNTIAGYIDTEVGAITPAGPTNTQMETARDAIITEVDANETKIDDLDGDLVTHETAQGTHRTVLVDIHDTDLPAVKSVADSNATQLDTKVVGRVQIVVHNDDLDSTAVGT